MALYSLFADILDYPAHPIAPAISDSAAQLASACPEARVHIVAFQNAIAEVGLGQLQENYINAFDLRPDCTPNLGYHLFGDDGRRGLFLAELKGRMELSGITLGSELPDHISFVLRYMQRDADECRILIEDCMLPAVLRMAEVLNSSENPYRHILCALLSLLQHQMEVSIGPPETTKV